ncbi:PKD domain-containing protein [Candidatus Bathyarchaeota archaeon]|nr:MAG: PKD domain-containing protein [Candidatus Bathyarchaeota archaeon]
MAKGYCGPVSTVCNNSTIAQYASNGAVSLDVQGFVYWDPEAPNPHWEIHPITGWRVHQSDPSLTTSFVSSPSSPAAGQQVTFTASASGGTAPYAFSWSFGDGSTGTGSSTTHTYSSPGAFTVISTVRDSGSPQQTASSQQPISVTSPQPFSDYHVHGLGFWRRLPVRIPLGLRRRRLEFREPDDPCLLLSWLLYSNSDRERFGRSHSCCLEQCHGVDV